MTDSREAIQKGRQTPITPPAHVLEFLANNYKYDPDTGQVWKKCGWVSKQGYGKLGFSFGSRGNAEKWQLVMHRVAWFLATGEWPPDSKFIDHINGQRADNRWENLRLCDAAGNAQNRRGWGKVPFRGVQYIPTLKTRPYLVGIGTWPNREVVGYFATAEEAAEAYRAAATEKYGDFFCDR